MITTDQIPPIYFWWLMSDVQTGGGGAVGGNANTGGGDFAGRDRSDNNVNIHFDRASNWDPEREELTALQRIRDLETFVFGDRRGLTIGIVRTLRHYLTWLVVLSIIHLIELGLLAVLVVTLLRTISRGGL